MMHRLELLAGCDLAQIAVVGKARRLVIDEHALGGVAATRPRFDLGGAQVRHIMGADDVEPVVAHEARIGRILLGAELVRELLGNDGVLRHALLPLPYRSRCSSSGAAAKAAARSRRCRLCSRMSRSSLRR